LKQRNQGEFINEPEQLGRTAYMLAAVSKSTHVQELLIQAGARIEVRDKKGSTAAYLAMEEPPKTQAIMREK